MQFLITYVMMLLNFFLQILKDEATREQYDYAIAHPEEVLFKLMYFFLPEVFYRSIILQTALNYYVFL